MADCWSPLVWLTAVACSRSVICPAAITATEAHSMTPLAPSRPPQSGSYFEAQACAPLSVPAIPAELLSTRANRVTAAAASS
jgi:hypothetical protein